MIAGGLPCGAALTDHSGVVIARGRNHAYDSSDGAMSSKEHRWPMLR
jgi:hypothetical protein